MTCAVLSHDLCCDLQVAFSGVTLYLVCVSTLLAALQPLALFSADSSPAHPLQQDPMQPPANMQVGQMVSRSACPLVPTISDGPSPPPWQEVWPTNRSLLCEASVPPRVLMTTFNEPAFDHWCPYNSIPPGVGHTPNTSSSSSASPKSGKSSMSNGRKQNLVDTFANSTSPLNIVTTPPLFCHSRGKNRDREPLAKVESPQAQDLSYHQKGTFHWDPFINSSSANDNETSMTGALTFIARYLTPHWIA